MSYEEWYGRLKASYAEKSGYEPDENGACGLRLRAMAAELYRLQTELNWLRRQAFPQTAAGEWLERHGEARGVARGAAKRAEGSITFSRYLPLSFDLVIPEGTVCAASGEDPVEYETTEAVVLPAGDLSIAAAARAVLPGSGGNCSAGQVNTLVDGPDGVNYVNNPKAFSGGKDTESDSAYRPRVLRAWAVQPNGVNAATYRDLALQVEGVAFANAVPRANGDNTVGVYVWGEDGQPDEALLAKVSAQYESRREIGVAVAVEAAAPDTVDVTVRVMLEDGADFERGVADITQAVSGYFAGLTVGSGVYLAQIEKAMLQAAPVIKLNFPVTMGDIRPVKNVIPLLGTVKVVQLA